MNIRKYLKHTMTRWEKKGSGSSGQSTFKEPVEMACRWEEGMEEVQMMDGRRLISSAYVMLAEPVNTWDICRARRA